VATAAEAIVATAPTAAGKVALAALAEGWVVQEVQEVGTAEKVAVATAEALVG